MAEKRVLVPWQLFAVPWHLFLVYHNHQLVLSDIHSSCLSCKYSFIYISTIDGSKMGTHAVAIICCPVAFSSRSVLTIN